MTVLIPWQGKYRAVRKLELVHGDPCGLVTPEVCQSSHLTVEAVLFGVYLQDSKLPTSNAVDVNGFPSIPLYRCWLEIVQTLHRLINDVYQVFCANTNQLLSSMCLTVVPL
jgi:hypothetical protein